MSMRMTYQQQGTIGGKQFPKKITIEDEASIVREVTLAAAKVGQLTTRTDANTGTLTMVTGHGITTGARISIFWDGGSRRGVTVGTVSVNSVPFDLGAGDDLPANSTAITAMVEDEEAMVLTGNNVTGFAVYSDVGGNITFAQSDGTEILGVQLLETPDGYSWASGCGVTNPLAGSSVAKVFFAHGDSTASRTMRAGAIYS